MKNERKRTTITPAILATIAIALTIAAGSPAMPADRHIEVRADAEQPRILAASPPVIAHVGTGTQSLYIPLPAPQATNVGHSEQPKATPEPAYNPETHDNGYCEGFCHEAICPYFEGYPEPPYDEADIEALAKMVWGEARGCSPEEQRLVVWTVLQRVDAGGEFARQTTIDAVLRRPYAFAAFSDDNPVDPDIYALVAQELADWWHGASPPTHETYAPTAPYYFFDGDGRHNWFREKWRP